MACCAGGGVQGAIPGYKFGKPLKENFHDGKVHPYIDSIMKYTVTKKERIRHPSGVKSKDLDRLRKLMHKRSDGLDLKKENITGAQGMAIIKEVLVRLPAPLLGKTNASVNAWMKAFRKANAQPSTTSWSNQELTDTIKLFKDALNTMEASGYLMLKYLVAFIRVLSQHPDTGAVREKQAQAMTKYYATAILETKSKKDDSALLSKGLYFLVENADELFEPGVEDWIFPSKLTKSKASRLSEELEKAKEEQNQELELKDYTMINDASQDQSPEDDRYGLGEHGDVKSKISGLDVDDPRLDGLDIWMYLVQNVEQQIHETKNTMSSTTNVAAQQ